MAVLLSVSIIKSSPDQPRFTHTTLTASDCSMVSKALRMQNSPTGPGGPRKHQEGQLNLSPYMTVNRNTLIRHVALGSMDFEQGR